jgi:hypothetical protein
MQLFVNHVYTFYLFIGLGGGGGGGGGDCGRKK